MQIRVLGAADREAVLALINAAAQAYRGTIPADLWREPYITAQALDAEFADGVVFRGAEDGGRLLGVMGIQDKDDVTLIRHAYVAPPAQRHGVGSALLRHLLGLTRKPVLIGTWAAATRAIAFYRRHDFVPVSEHLKEALLERYWSVPPRQVEASVVLADRRWFATAGDFPAG